jgi:hypothetical protein
VDVNIKMEIERWDWVISSELIWLRGGTIGRVFGTE